ncbi:MAG: serine hydrolase [Candidatus Dojkabacteria bacterium]|nr:MAG: serine hydrolase [Candidatus Dojkabacteria bacterium]
MIKAKKTIIAFSVLTVLLVGLFTTYLYLTTRTDTYIGRWFAWKASDVEDYKKFPAATFIASDSPYYLEVADDQSLGEQKFEQQGSEVELDRLLEENDTTAFIVVKDGKIIYEEYFNEYERTSINTSFSTAKSITALMIGVAIEEGAIESLDDPVTKYLPELSDTDPDYQDVTIEDLLSMKSGIEFADHDLPWGDKPKAYYHPDLRTHVMSLQVTGEPGEEFQYNSYNPILLGMILEEATGMKAYEYFEQKLWSRLGMEYEGSWSLDSEQGGMTKMESGINARAIDFAKLGVLVQDKGEWDGEQLISSEWIEDSMEMNEVNAVPEYGDDLHYNRGWWLTDAEDDLDSVAGWGHLGQYIYVFPEKNMVIVRFGTGQGDLAWGELIEDVAAAVE